MRLAATRPDIARPDRTIHFLTDVHSGALATSRQQKILDDAPMAIRSAPVLRVHGGDITNEDSGNGNVNTTAFDTLAANLITGFVDAAPYVVGIGNHDVFQTTRTATQFCTAMTNLGVAGLSGKTDVNQVVSLGTWGKAIVIGDNLMPSISFTQTTLDWLDATLTTYAAYPCLIFAHPPLEGTFGSVNSSDSTVPVSTDVTYFSKRQGDSHDTYIRTLLGSHTNAKGWFSGHCHPHPTFTVDGSSNQTVNQTLTLSGRAFAHVIGGAGYYTHPGVDFFDPVFNTYLTYLGDASGGVLEVRHRDCQAHQWVPVGGQIANSLTVG